MNFKSSCEAKLRKRAILQYVMGFGFILLNIVLFFIWPKIAYIPLILIPFMILSAFFWSRGFCGWVCPRASFMERYFKYLSLNKKTPTWLNLWWVSLLVFGVLISRVTYVGYTKGLLAAGFLLCVVPTIGALLFGWYSPKSWCAICPTGSILKVVDRGIFRVRKNNCKQCKKCDAACPMGIAVSEVPENSYINAPNCTQCGLCVPSCPIQALEMPRNIKKEVKQESNLSV